MTTAAIPIPTPALAPVERPDEAAVVLVVGGVEVVGDVWVEVVPEAEPDVELELDEDVVDVLEEKSFALYRIETP